mmetsp:Transcript_18603/g.30348  ORF Transcript_18603/g.30348 Transcript_18603/m.30348 type:complete len:224 (-) Transcript_18603:213-884(-)
MPTKRPFALIRPVESKLLYRVPTHQHNTCNTQTMNQHKRLLDNRGLCVVIIPWHMNHLSCIRSKHRYILSTIRHHIYLPPTSFQPLYALGVSFDPDNCTNHRQSQNSLAFPPPSLHYATRYIFSTTTRKAYRNQFRSNRVFGLVDNLLEIYLYPDRTLPATTEHHQVPPVRVYRLQTPELRLRAVMSSSQTLWKSVSVSGTVGDASPSCRQLNAVFRNRQGDK